jgi:hypothetical protein
VSSTNCMASSATASFMSICGMLASNGLEKPRVEHTLVLYVCAPLSASTAENASRRRHGKAMSPPPLQIRLYQLIRCRARAPGNWLSTGSFTTPGGLRGQSGVRRIRSRP